MSVRRVMRGGRGMVFGRRWAGGAGTVGRGCYILYHPSGAGTVGRVGPHHEAMTDENARRDDITGRGAGGGAKGILDAAMRRPASERPAYVEEACGADVAMRDEVLSLLRFAEVKAPGLDNAYGDVLLAAAGVDWRRARCRCTAAGGSEWGRARLVYEAEQLEPVRAPSR